MRPSPFVQRLLDERLLDGPSAVALRRETGDRDFPIAERVFDTLDLPADRHQLGALYGDSIGRAHVPLDQTLFQREALDRLPVDMARKLVAIPIYRLGETITLAAAHPEDEALQQLLAKLTGTPVSLVFAFPQEIENAIDIQYGTGDHLTRLSDQLSGGAATERMTSEQLQTLSASSGVVELVQGLLLYCIQHKASDIHIQPTARTLDVRMRVDGELQTLLRLNRYVMPPVMSRLKVMASLDITERRQPQDGRLSLELRHRRYEFRLSTVPMVFGEKAVLRLIGSADQLAKPMDQLGMSAVNRRLLTQLTRRPGGLLFVTGPTGSGKTTTLYAALAALHRPEINIVTVEDPVELRIDGITQIQTNAAIGLDFAKVLRAVLRQDPQVLLIGEIRDLETARIASQAAQTGHLVMATMHANDSLQAMTRLTDIGLDPFIVAPTVIGIMAQRLVRRICEHCRERYEPSPELLDQLFYGRDDTPVYFHRGRGCVHCNGSGHAGRIALHEVFMLDNQLRELIIQRASLPTLQREMARQGFRSMRYDGVMKVLRGITSMDEVERVCMP